MATLKRIALDGGLQRRIRARREPSQEHEENLLSLRHSKSPSPVTRSGSPSSVEDNSEDDDEDSDESSIRGSKSTNNAKSISFGALARAQAVIERPNKNKALHGRPPTENSWEDTEALERKAGHKDNRDFNRSSKHAPTEISSKKAVSRKREVVAVAKRAHRDPRFDPLTGPVDDAKTMAAYSFLDDYRNDEMDQLKAAIKVTKDEEAKSKLKRKLMSMESRKKADLRKAKEQEVLDRHRKEEKSLVMQGKKPFYLKKAEQKKRVLLENFGELKGKRLDHVIERRRKKIEQREKRNLPYARRTPK